MTIRTSGKFVEYKDMKAAVWNAHLTMSEKIVLLYLLNHRHSPQQDGGHNPKMLGWAWPGHETVAWHVDLSVARVSLVIASLEVRGVLFSKPHPVQSGKMYYMDFDVLRRLRRKNGDTSKPELLKRRSHGSGERRQQAPEGLREFLQAWNSVASEKCPAKRKSTKRIAAAVLELWEFGQLHRDHAKNLRRISEIKGELQSVSRDGWQLPHMTLEMLLRPPTGKGEYVLGNLLDGQYAAFDRETAYERFNVVG